MAIKLLFEEFIMTTLYDIPVTLQDGTVDTLTNYNGHVLLIVNTATGCGLTPQYQALQQLYDTYRTRNFTILDFPCNQFNEQAPEDDLTINEFCSLNYHTTFPRFKKIDVNGTQQAPLFAFLKQQKKGLFNDDIKWNFTKFLIDRQGNVVKRYAPQTNPTDIINDIEVLL